MKKLLSELYEIADTLPINYSDKKVLLFIGARTIRYDKISETIPTRHFLEGCNGTRPCGVPRATLKRSQLRLADAGFVRIRHRKGEFGDLANEYTLNLVAIKEAAMTSKLKTPRKPVSRCYQRGLKMIPGGSQNETPEVDTLKVDKKRSSQVTSAASSARCLGEIVEKAKEKTRDAQARKAGRLSKTRSADALRSAWGKAVHAAYPDKTPSPVSPTLAARFRHMTVSMLPTGESLAEFVEWAVSNWEEIRTHFRWMKKPPVPLFPDLQWCAHHCTRLLQARDQIDARAAERMDLTEKGRLERELRETKTELSRERHKNLATANRIDKSKPPARIVSTPPSEYGITFEEGDDEFPEWEDIK